jgi:hypothetical protein
VFLLNFGSLNRDCFSKLLLIFLFVVEGEENEILEIIKELQPLHDDETSKSILGFIISEFDFNSQMLAIGLMYDTVEGI